MSSSELPLLIQATVSMYLTSARAATAAIKRNWMIILGSVLAYFLFVLILPLLAPFGVGGGFLAGLLKIALLTFYYSWLTAAYRKERLTPACMREFDLNLFLTIISVGFVLWIIEELTRPLIYSEQTFALYFCLQLGIFLVLNALPEVVFIQRSQSIYALRETASFVVRNWIEWFIPLILLFAPLIATNPHGVLLLFTGATMSVGADPLLPPLVLVTYLDGLFSHHFTPGFRFFSSVCAVAVANWFMLFRAYLFADLQSGSRRSRVYRARQ